jgi:hypothetical protein
MADVALSTAAATALEESRGYCVAISSIGAQIRNPGSSDANMSKHAMNRLIEFIVLGSFCFIDMTCRLIRCGMQTIPECARLRLRPGSSARVWPLTLELGCPSIHPRFPRRQPSISRPGARIGFLEGP